MPHTPWQKLQTRLARALAAAELERDFKDVIVLDSSTESTIVLPEGARPCCISPRHTGIRAYWDDAAYGSRGRCFYCGCDLTIAALCPHCGGPRRK